MSSYPVYEEKGIPNETSTSFSSEDVEGQGLSKLPQLKRKLKSRHLQMIAIGMQDLIHIMLNGIYLMSIHLQAELSALDYSSEAEMHSPRPVLPVS
jgi:hypothetical protein